MRELFIVFLAWLTGGFVHPKMELATVGDDYAVFYRRSKGTVEPIRLDNLKPAHSYDFYGSHFTTLARPSGKLLCTFASVNDVHIGETICGFDSHHPKRGPILRNEEGKIPYAEMMSRNAVDEISKINPDAVLVKGDITDAGKPEEFKKFLEIWGKFGRKLHWVCGNHDVHSKRPDDAQRMVKVELKGITLALLDTAIEGKPNGQVSQDQLDWLRAIAEASDRPVMVFGHHHIWNPKYKREEKFFGIQPDDSEKLLALFREHKCMVGYFSGHTHSNHVEFMDDMPGVPFAQTGAVKEFPGAWIEYKVYENGIQQIMHRLNSDECLRWEEMTSCMELGRYEKRHFGKLSDRCFTIATRKSSLQ